MVIPLGLLLGAGGLIGAYIGSTLSSLYLSDMKTFQPLFGLLTLAIAAQSFWKLYRMRGAAGGQAEREPALAGVGPARLSRQVLRFCHGAERFELSIWSPLVAGGLISLTASVFGVGGGFLLVPYMTIVLGMPMHIVPATAAIAIFMSLSVSIGNFLWLGAPVEGDILIPMIAGTVIGAVLGPRINTALKNSLLQLLMALIVMAIGLKYVVF